MCGNPFKAPEIPAMPAPPQPPALAAVVKQANAEVGQSRDLTLRKMAARFGAAKSNVTGGTLGDATATTKTTLGA